MCWYTKKMIFGINSFLQLQLLLQYLRDDPRKAVKMLTINDLKLLAKKAPHLWIRENTQVRGTMVIFTLVKRFYVIQLVLYIFADSVRVCFSHSLQ